MLFALLEAGYSPRDLVSLTRTDSTAPAPPLKQARPTNGHAPLPSPRQLSSPRVRPDARLALKREYAQLKAQLAAFKNEYTWIKMDARSQGLAEPAKPQEMVDLEARMKVLTVEKKKQRQQQGAAEDDAASLAAAGASGYQRRKPMGSDKVRPLSSSPLPPACPALGWP